MSQDQTVKLRADLRADPPVVELLDDHRGGLTLCIHGTLTRAVVDDLLVSAGAGRFLGHHAEVLVEWVCSQSPGQAPNSKVMAMGADWQVDQTGRWLAVPVEWGDDRSRAVSGDAVGVTH